MSSISFTPLHDVAVALREIFSEMPSSSFPLLRLPLVAFKEVIENIELKDQCKLAFCSKRMYNIVKYYQGKLPLSLKLHCAGGDVGICLFNQKNRMIEDNRTIEVTFGVRAEGDIYCWDLYSGQFTRFRETERLYCLKTNFIEKLQYPLVESERLLSKEKNVIQETNFLVEFLFDLFAAKVEEVEVYDNKIWMPDFFKKYENLTIHGGKWMTGENLCQLDCVKLNIYDQYFLNRFSSTEINRYFKHVLTGGTSRLMTFSAGVQNPNEDVIMDGIRELLTESQRVANTRLGHWNVIGKVARGEGLVLVSITVMFQNVHLEIKQEQKYSPMSYLFV